MNAALERQAQALVQLVRARASEQECSAEQQVSALTVKQPHAWLLAFSSQLWPVEVEPKTVECLSWRTEAGAERFGRVAIHVSSTWRRAEVEEQVEQLRARGLLGGRCQLPPLEQLEQQRGHVIGIGRLVRIEQTGPLPRSAWATPHTWGWEFECLRPIRPVAVRSPSSRGLWALPPSTPIAPATRGGYSLRCGKYSRIVQRPTDVWSAIREWKANPSDKVEIDGEVVTVAEALARAADDFADSAPTSEAREEARGIAEYWRRHGRAG